MRRLQDAPGGEGFAEAWSRNRAGVRAALVGVERRVAPVTGGDDIRVFLPPEHLLEYVSRLATEVEARAGAKGELHALLSPDAARQLVGVGIGIGAVVAPYHYPASRLIDYAHEFEVSAKKICRQGGARSSFDFAVLTSGDEMIQGRKQSPALAVPGKEWERLRKKARLLAALPKSQRSQLFRLHEREVDEQRNLFAYQVARSDAWQGWFDQLGIDWRVREQLHEHMPDDRLIALAQLEPLPVGEKKERGR